jgi:hypothetical protein
MPLEWERIPGPPPRATPQASINLGLLLHVLPSIKKSERVLNRTKPNLMIENNKVTKWVVTKVSLPLRQVGSVPVACGRLAIQPAALRFAPQQGPGIIVTDH